MKRMTRLNFDPLDGEGTSSAIALLMAIDRAILEINESTDDEEIEDIFLESLSKFAHIHGLARPPACFAFMGSDFRSLDEDRRAGGGACVPVTRSLAELIEFSTPSGARLIEHGEDPDLFDALGAAGALLVSPIYTPGRHPLCVLVAWSVEEECAQLRQCHVRQAFDALTQQLSIAYRQFERVRFHARLHDLWAEFLDQNLSPSTCFQSLAKAIPGFLPTFGPINLAEASPETQILMIERPEGAREHLVIRGTTGSEHGGTRIDVDRSISGLLVTEPHRPFFCADPTLPEYRGRYRRYLGDLRHPTRTELAVRMEFGDRNLGVINIESARENAFSYLHQQTLLELAATFGRFAAVLEQRLAMNTSMQNSVATSTKNYLDALAQTYRHGIKTPLVSLRTDTDTFSLQLALAGRIIERAAKPPPPEIGQIAAPMAEMRQIQRRLSYQRNKIAHYSEDFIDGISGYANLGRMVLRELVDSAIQLADNSLLKERARYIRIRVTKDASGRDTEIFCSTLMKQHFYSIFHNAVDAIKARMLADERPGRITVRIVEEEIPEDQEERLNKTWIVFIRDNGGGVTDAQLDALRRFEPGTTFKGGGNGHGLTAAQRYVTSIGGRIELNSARGKFFETAIYFQSYEPAIHGNLQRLSRRGRLNG